MTKEENMYNNYQTLLYESDECLTKGICSVNPTLNSLQEIVLLHLKELAFYMLKLKDFGVTNEYIKETFLYTLSSIILNIEYNQEQFHEIISKLYDDIEQSKILYENFCKDSAQDIKSVKTYFKRSKKFSLADAIKKGEKYFFKKSNSFTSKQKSLFDIMLFLVKSICIKILELKSLGQELDESYYAILSMMNAMNFNEFSEERAEKEIKTFIYVYYKIVAAVFYAQVELYGEITPTEVSFSTVPGKAILISGSDFKKLELVLKAVENTEINIYTHGLEMLMAHAFPKFRSHPNLKGHFGIGMETSLIDFAEFQGAILMTKANVQRTEYLYRGRLFTLDPFAQMGVIRIKDYNFEPLIKSALEARGFTSGRQKPPIKVGFNEAEINEKIDFIIEKMLNNEIKHLYIIGLLNTPDTHKQYFDKFFELMPKECYAISLSYDKNTENVFHVDSFYDYSLLYKIIKRISEKKPLNEMNISIFLTKCDKHTIANLLYLKEIGIKNVYMCKCPPTLVNPPLMETLQEIFKIKEFSDPEKELHETLA